MNGCRYPDRVSPCLVDRKEDRVGRRQRPGQSPVPQPALVAGVLTTDTGLRGTSLGYGSAVALVAVGTLLYEIRAMRRPAMP